jgi:hypothetical protein
MDNLTEKVNKLFQTMTLFTTNMKEYMTDVMEKKQKAKEQKTIKSH